MRITAPAASAVPWSAVLTDLRARPGVERVGFDVRPLPGPGGPVVTAVITVEFNRLGVDATTLAGAVAAHGLEPVTTVSPEPVGGHVVVPPPASRP